ncbi:hypothetical protein CEXT_668751 [Caerostris extrusa]|uniref:Uncharacterized protein n=1 Tax=Caerostris extrusa TaxID=172846 RepID=A0AAV4NGN1_CAEEX|nr:hypothetical protein CEXT_668751 [Caerostris extrusa]
MSPSRHFWNLFNFKSLRHLDLVKRECSVNTESVLFVKKVNFSLQDPFTLRQWPGAKREMFFLGEHLVFSSLLFFCFDLGLDILQGIEESFARCIRQGRHLAQLENVLCIFRRMI